MEHVERYSALKL